MLMRRQPGESRLGWLKDRTTRTARVVALVVSFAAISFVLTYRYARAQVDESLIGLGSELMRYDGAWQTSEKHTIELNGAQLYMQSGLTDDAPSEVLDHFQSRCEMRDMNLGAELAAHGIVDAPEDAEHPTLRADDGQTGYVACLDSGGVDLTLAMLMQRLELYAANGDLAQLGDLRYVFVRPDGNGGAHFVNVWTEGKFEMFKMFPERGDAPGFDVAGIVRPPGSKRILSAREQGKRYEMAMYTGTYMTGDALETFYQEELPEAGWHIVSGEAFPDDEGGRLLLLTKDDEMFGVVITELEDGTTAATVLSMNEETKS